MKKIGIALTLVLWGLEVTHAQNGGQLKQAQVSTARQTPQQITDQYLASQKSLTQRKVALSQALEQELARGQNANASNVYNITCIQLVPILTAMRVNDEQLLGFLQSMNPNQSNNGVKAVLRQNHALESKTLNNCKQLKSLL
ncbi:hypothetical protein JW980_03135 [Acinetobacter johnsonii]|jgi:hypothetical protein|uniref:Uncharacterized protein n=1 Tax=Acinetobacter johnsonii TaxID=40214 RepID=A0AA42LJG2_ACIJO|nr:hypothetical protein [Acinetobacter johnsonii]MCU4327970.1 hypothetical protein [Acinetobacter johnsonii]MDH0657610.1 hypothetical protein [Acinetobacter johnsonii]QQT58506.1 hypothetical protein I6I50_02415 [Acinetobacter johnsonii]QSE46432.1 hypothetical protein JW980_03135 [Acinetobacter johnsonii]